MLAGSEAGIRRGEPIFVICASGSLRRWRRGRELLVGGGDVQGQRCQCGEVVAAVPCDWKPAARPMGGNRLYVLSSERDWLL